MRTDWIEFVGPMIAAAMAFGLPAVARAEYNYTNLHGSVPGNNLVSRAYAINNAGVILGDYAPATGTSSFDYTFFTYSSGTLTPFPTVSGGRLLYDQTTIGGGRTINDSGVFAAGKDFTTTAASTTLQQGVYNPATSTFTAAPFPQTYVSPTQIPLSVRITGINNSGLAVGTAFFTDSTTNEWANGNNHGVIFNTATGTTTDIGGAIINPGGSAATGYSTLNSIADNGTIVGNAGNGNGSAAFIGTPGSGGYTYTDLTSTLSASLTPGGFTFEGSSVDDISNNGKYIIGTYGISNADGDYFSKAYLYTVGGSAVDLGTLDPDAFGVNPHGVNDLGQVVGNIVGAGVLQAFLYSDGVMSNLNTLAPIAGTEFTDAQDINNSGQIVGVSRIGGQFNAFLLSPVPEPAVVGLVGVGAIALMRRTRKD